MLMTQNGNGCLVTEMKREEGSMVKWTEGKESSICFSPWAACDNRCCESLLMGYNTQNGLSFNSDCGTFFTLSWPLRSQLFWRWPTESPSSDSWLRRDFTSCLCQSQPVRTTFWPSCLTLLSPRSLLSSASSCLCLDVTQSPPQCLAPSPFQCQLPL